ncbi:MAG: DegT/DnrJ/EryC1/StrS family aminotransferase, partial [Treponema socranskii subsp. buccale]
LQSRGIGVSVHFIPLFHFTYRKKLYPEFRAFHFPNAQKRFASTISIPLWPGMTNDMTTSVIEAVLSIGAAHHA